METEVGPKYLANLPVGTVIKVMLTTCKADCHRAEITTPKPGDEGKFCYIALDGPYQGIYGSRAIEEIPVKVTTVDRNRLRLYSPTNELKAEYEITHPNQLDILERPLFELLMEDSQKKYEKEQTPITEKPTPKAPNLLSYNDQKCNDDRLQIRSTAMSNILDMIYVAKRDFEILRKQGIEFQEERDVLTILTKLSKAARKHQK